MIVTVKRTKQIAQFEPLTIEQSIELDDYDTSRVNTEAMLQEIDAQINSYIASQPPKDGGISIKQLAKLVYNVAKEIPNNMDEFQDIGTNAGLLMKEVRNYHKTTEEYKNRKSNSNVDNQQNRSK